MLAPHTCHIYAPPLIKLLPVDALADILQQVLHICVITSHDVCLMQITATIHQAICRGLADCHFLVVVDITIFVYLYIVGVLALVDRGGDAYTAYTRYIQLADYDSCTQCVLHASDV